MESNYVSITTFKVSNGTAIKQPQQFVTLNQGGTLMIRELGETLYNGRKIYLYEYTTIGGVKFITDQQGYEQLGGPNESLGFRVVSTFIISGGSASNPFKTYVNYKQLYNFTQIQSIRYRGGLYTFYQGNSLLDKLLITDQGGFETLIGK
jgi:hypothetical protein